MGRYKSCQCGCGGYTQARFCPGHDAKLKSRLKNDAKYGWPESVRTAAQLELVRYGWDKVMRPGAYRGARSGGRATAHVTKNTPTERRTEVIYGYRMWSVGEVRKGILQSQWNQSQWKPFEPFAAQCASYKYNSALPINRNNHPAPWWDCNCGIFSYKRRDHAEKHAHTDTILVGKIAMWGKVIEHDTGYRAEFAYPVHIHMLNIKMSDAVKAATGVEFMPPDPSVVQALKIYGVPVTSDERRDMWVRSETLSE